MRLGLEDVRAHVQYKVLAGELAPDVAERMLTALESGLAHDYESAHRVAVFRPLPLVVFHTAPVTSRASILTHGLLPAAPSSSASWLAAGQPVGVYVSAEPDERGIWTRGLMEEWDLWEVRTAGLREGAWKHDTLNPGCWLLVDGASPDRISLRSTHRW